MYTKLLGSAAAASVTLFALPALALTTLTIDNFDGNQRVTDVPGTGNVNMSQAADDGIIGGFRDLSVMNTVSGGDSTDATELRVTPIAGEGALTFSNIRGARGEGTITYDGNDDPTTLDTAGLGGINFLIGDNPRFFFDVPPNGFDNDANAFFSADVYDTSGNRVSYRENLSAGFSPFLAFDQLTGDAGFDFGSVGALRFMISTTDTEDNIDGQINGIEIQADDVAPIPLPASGVLLLAGLGGFGALRRFRKA